MDTYKCLHVYLIHCHLIIQSSAFYRLYEEIRIFLNQDDLVVPTSDRNLVLELPAWLKLASNSGRRIMLVLDALNQLDSGAGSNGETHPHDDIGSHIT